MKAYVSLALWQGIGCATLLHAWIPQSHLGQPWLDRTDGRQSTSTTRLFLDLKPEQLLRREIAARNTLVENEVQYAVADGEYLEKLDNMEVVAASLSSMETGSEPKMAPNSNQATGTVGEKGHQAHSSKSITSTLERITKPRAYPLFLLEKFAEIAENTVSDLTHSMEGLGLSTSPRSGSDTLVKERIVILGTGWGGASFLKEIDNDLYDVTIISPRNHFVFTPMLAGASVGTVEFRSICEPIRELNRHAQYLEATATDIDPATNTVTCQSVVCDGNSCDVDEFIITYDRLVVTIGAQTNTFGIPGVREHCCFLRQVEDARRIRTAMINCFERANLPNVSDEERVRNLTFAVIGAGPTGIEFAAELRDFIEQDGPKYYPHLLKYVRIKVIEAASTILAPFDKSLQQEAIQRMMRSVDLRDPEVRNLIPERFMLTELLLESSVKQVGEKTIALNNGMEVPYGLAVWAAGNGPIPLTLQLIERLGEEQAKVQSTARGRIAVDPWLRAIGGGGKILAFGDCSCVCQNALPATAQVASQQAEYLANLLNRKFELSPAPIEGMMPPPKKDAARTESSLSDAIAGFAINNYEYAKPFQFWNLGILAYTGGGSALAQVSPAPNAAPIKGTGGLGNAVWRSVYLSKQVSWRNRLLVLNDWTKRALFGRDVTRL